MKPIDYLTKYRSEWLGVNLSGYQRQQLFNDYKKQGGSGNIEQFLSQMKDKKFNKYLAALKPQTVEG